MGVWDSVGRIATMGSSVFGIGVITDGFCS
jgi:hypothetical protein